MGREVVVAALIAGSTSGAAGQEPAAPAADDTLGAADFSWTLQSLDGVPVELADFRGQVLFINLWATWCTPCVAELRTIERLEAAVAGTEVAFLLVSPEEPQQVERFARRFDFDLRFLVEAEEIPSAFGVRALPTTWIVDRQGRIVMRHRGAAAWDTPEVVALLGKLASPQQHGQARPGGEPRSSPGLLPSPATRKRSRGRMRRPRRAAP